jgi:hypothetical protein
MADNEDDERVVGTDHKHFSSNRLEPRGVRNDFLGTRYFPCHFLPFPAESFWPSLD